MDPMDERHQALQTAQPDGLMLRAQTQRWKLVDMASGAPLADIVADAGISLMHISADEGGRLQSEVVGRHVERACLGPPACASCQPCARSG